MKEINVVFFLMENTNFKILHIIKNGICSSMKSYDTAHINNLAFRNLARYLKINFQKNPKFITKILTQKKNNHISSSENWN